MAKILVIDDSKAVRNLLNHSLSSYGAEVALAEDGIEGLKLARDTRYDLIITDLEMPRMDGFELCQEMKRSPLPGTPPVLVMSADFSEDSVDWGFRMGVWGYLPKYNLNKELLPKVREILDHKMLATPWRALIVEDSEAVNSMIRQGLSAAGFQADCTRSGAQAIKILQTSKPDLIISELNLPDMPALKLLKSVKRNTALDRVPFVVLSHVGGHSAAMKMISHGAAAYLMKPFNPGQLIPLARRLLTQRREQLEVENHTLMGEFQAMFGGIADLVKALEARDPFTRGHSQAVSDISLQIGHALGLPPDRMKRLHLAAQLHDLGKIGLSDAVLLKPDTLSPQEYEEVKRHSEMGAQLLNPFTQLHDIAPALLQHHERYDGTGYPGGIKGDSIDLFARIIAVSDTYDSLTSARPYREPITHQEAMAVVRDAQESQLCPRCVSAFLSVMEKDTTPSPQQCSLPDDAPKTARRRRRTTLDGKVIMIADANRLFFKGVAEQLKARGARKVVHAATGDAAWKMLYCEQPDMFICDWKIPGLTPRQLMEKMAWSEDFCTIHTVITTQDMDRGQLAEIAEIRPSAILKKPCSMKKLTAKIETLLSPKNARQGEKAPRAKKASPKNLAEIISLTVGALTTEIDKCAADIERQYKSRMCRFFSVYTLPLPTGDIEKAGSRCLVHVNAEFVDKCADQLSRLSTIPGDDESLFRQTTAEFISGTQLLLADASVHFYTHFRRKLMSYLLVKKAELANDASVNWVVDEFRRDLSDRASQLHNSQIDLLNDSLKQCQDIAANDCKLDVHDLIDAFGRGLMEPLNDLYPIAELVEGPNSKKKHFPRQFCAPVLSVVRDYVIGLEKYEKANRNILRSVRQFMGKDTGFEMNRLRDYFSHPRIRQYYVGSILYCLQKLTSEVRRDSFIRKVNSQIRQSSEAAATPFDVRAWTMLSRSWAHSVKNNLGDKQKENKSVESILENYLYH